MTAPEPQPEHWPTRLVDQRVAKKGLRPRVAAGVIATLWLIAIVVFGVIEHLTNPEAFENVWVGMWWATQTVTTVGYGDVVPEDTAGRAIASVLMVGGLSLFAIVTGVITSTFVARAQAEAQAETNDPMLAKMVAIEAQLTELKADVARLSAGLDQGPRSGPDA